MVVGSEVKIPATQPSIPKTGSKTAFQERSAGPPHCRPEKKNTRKGRETERHSSSGWIKICTCAPIMPTQRSSQRPTTAHAKAQARGIF